MTNRKENLKTYIWTCWNSKSGSYSNRYLQTRHRLTSSHYLFQLFIDLRKIFQEFAHFQTHFLKHYKVQIKTWSNLRTQISVVKINILDANWTQIWTTLIQKVKEFQKRSIRICKIINFQMLKRVWCANLQPKKYLFLKFHLKK
jgi:hypothetical protein